MERAKYWSHMIANVTQEKTLPACTHLLLHPHKEITSIFLPTKNGKTAQLTVNLMVDLFSFLQASNSGCCQVQSYLIWETVDVSRISGGFVVSTSCIVSYCNTQTVSMFSTFMGSYGDHKTWLENKYQYGNPSFLSSSNEFCFMIFSHFHFDAPIV